MKMTKLYGKKILATTVVLLLAGGVMVSAQTGDPGQAPAPATNVDNVELEQFAEALQGIQTAQEEVQQEMQEVVEASPLGQDRFNEIHEVVNTTGDVPGDVDDTEVESYSAIVQELSGIQQDLQMQMATIVEENGMDVERFNSIVMAVQQDEEMWQRVQQAMN